MKSKNADILKERQLASSKQLTISEKLLTAIELSELCQILKNGATEENIIVKRTD